MKKEEYEIGEVFQCGLVTLKCESSVSNCDKCYFQGFTNCAEINRKITGSCIRPERKDNTDVIFVEVDEYGVK